MMRLLAPILALLALLPAGPLAAQDLPPRPAGPVYDGADVIPAEQEAALDQRLRAYTQSTGRAVIVATVPALDGLPVDMYAQQLAETWQVGGAETEEGVLMLVAPTERDAWITTARGVQTTMTDAMAGRIFRDRMVPAFREGNYPGGIAAGVEGIIETLDMDPATAAAIAEAEAAAARAGGSGGKAAATVGGVIFWIVMILGFMFLFGRGGKGRRHSRYGGAANAVGNIVLWTALNALSQGGRGGGGFGDGGGGGFGGFGGGGGGFNGGGAGGSW